MRISVATLLALPLLAAARERSVYEHLYDKWNEHKHRLYTPNKETTFATAAGSAAVQALSLDDWNATLYAPVAAGAAEPVEWWVLMSGGNKTCFGLCGSMEAAYRGAAQAFAEDETAPRLAYVNCDDQPVLCNSWSARPPGLWVMNVRAAPKVSTIQVVTFNVSNTHISNFTELHATKSWNEKPFLGGYFHPLEGPIAKAGLAPPIGWVTWFTSLFPRWTVMLLVSIVTRSLRNKIHPPMPEGEEPAGEKEGSDGAQTAGPARVPRAPAGDGVSY